jgi:hypothetical protein
VLSTNIPVSTKHNDQARLYIIAEADVRLSASGDEGPERSPLALSVKNSEPGSAEKVTKLVAKLRRQTWAAFPKIPRPISKARPSNPYPYCLNSRALPRIGLTYKCFVNRKFTKDHFFELAEQFKNIVYCKPWVVKIMES